MTSAPTLTTPRLRLRPIAAEDYPHWRDFYATDHSRFVGGPLSAEAAWWKLAQFIGHWALTGFGYWSVETREGAYLGRVGLEQAVGWPEPELGWSLLPAATGQGYASEAAIAVRSDAWARLRPSGIVSFIKTGNAASVRTAERLGAVLEQPPRHPCPYEDHATYRHPAPEGAAS